MQKRNMVPLVIYKTDAGCLKKNQWRIIDPGALSPWNVMSWGLRQLKGVVIGSDESSPKLQVQELVLVENLKVRLHFHCRLLVAALTSFFEIYRRLANWF